MVCKLILNPAYFLKSKNLKTCKKSTVYTMGDWGLLTLEINKWRDRAHSYPVKPSFYSSPASRLCTVFSEMNSAVPTPPGWSLCSHPQRLLSSKISTHSVSTINQPHQCSQGEHHGWQHWEQKTGFIAISKFWALSSFNPGPSSQNLSFSIHAP